MSKSKVDKMILDRGCSKQCLFCRRILFTEKHIQNIMSSSLSHGFTENKNTIDDSGYCKEC